MATSLEQRDYIGTANDIDHLADNMLAAQGHLDTVPRLYLRATVATTINALDAPQRVRSAKVQKIDEAEQVRQLAALEKVIGLFYPRVVAKMSVNLPAKDKAKVLNSRTNWARSAHRDVRNWIRAGHDLRTIAACRLIRAAIVVAPPPRQPDAGRVRKRVERESKTLVASVMELATTDKTAAVAELQLLMGQLAGQLEELGVRATKDAKVAKAEHRPLQIGKTMFYPSDTQVVRMQENPS